MSSERVLPRIAIVGCGAAAREFCLPVLSRFRDYRHHAVLVDKSAEQAEATAREFGIENWCADYRSLPIEVDAAMITTPHQLHAEQACHFLSRGTHVFVEKPLGMSADETAQMLEAADAHHAVLMVNNYRRLFPAYGQVRAFIQSSAFGSVRKISIQDGTRFAWASVSGFYLRDPRARGVLFDRGAHTIDIIGWWLGGQPRVIRAETDAPDAIEAVAHLQLECNGIPVDIEFSRLQRLKNYYEIECDRATIRGRLFDFARLQVVRGGRIENVKAGKSRSYAEWAWQLVTNFVEVVQGRAEPIFVARDVASSIAVIEQAYQLAEPCELPWYQQDPNVAAITLSQS